MKGKTWILVEFFGKKLKNTVIFPQKLSHRKIFFIIPHFLTADFQAWTRQIIQRFDFGGWFHQEAGDDAGRIELVYEQREEEHEQHRNPPRQKFRRHRHVCDITKSWIKLWINIERSIVYLVDIVHQPCLLWSNSKSFRHAAELFCVHTRSSASK